MAPAPDRRDRGRRHSPGESTSPARDRMWNRSRSLPRREKERPREKEREKEKEKERERSPSKRSTSAHRTRDNSLRDRSSSPDHERPKAKTFSRSPSPRTKRLRRAQVELEGDRSVVRERERSDGREERDWNGRHREREDGRDGASERRLGREKDDGGSSRASRHERAASPQERAHNRSRRGSRSPARASKSGAREEAAKTREVEIRDDDSDSVAKMKAAEDALKVKDKQKPSFELSGKLAEETNRVRGVTLLFTEPSDARKPDIRWRLYVFKAGEVQNDPLYLHRQSCYLFGRERRVADIPTDHPSCSKQHAVIQYRLVETEQPDGLLTKQVRPYLMDLGSTNGTFINDNRIEPQRYYELFEKDTIRFGNSSREYVLLHENSTK